MLRSALTRFRPLRIGCMQDQAAIDDIVVTEGGHDMRKRITKRILLAAILTLIIGVLPAHSLYAATAREIDVSVDVALEKFIKDVKGSKEYLDAAKGVLVIPRVVEAGLIAGGQYGEGALRIQGKTVEYYSIAAGSFGLQIGAQEKNIIL